MLVVSLQSLLAAEITPEKSSYAYPLESVARLYSANFGEMRSNHFHSGVDIKSDGVEGKRVVSAADGYVSRLSISPSGYGVSIYVTHPSEGTTTQYGHLSKFRDDIEEYAQAERYRLRQHSVNIFLTASQFPVKRGELIGYSGNSGSSSGPHLHYEVRESKEQRPLNPVTIGAIKPVDDIKPIFTHLYYIESESIDGVVYPNRMSKYEVERRRDGSYQVKGNRLIWVGREGHFVVAVYDRKNGVHNKFGLYSVDLKRGNELLYRHQQDGFLFSETRYCNSVSYYPMQRKTSVAHYRLRRQEGLPSSMLHTVKGDGMLRTKVGEQHRMSVVACDDMGNSATLNFHIRGKDNKDCFKAKRDPKARIVRAKSATSFKDDGVEVKIPSGALYESRPYAMSVSGAKATLADDVSGCRVYSREYNLLDYDTPLHKAVEISVKANIPAAELERAVMVYVDEKGRQSAIKGSFKSGWYRAPSRVTGAFFIATDLESPTVDAEFEDGADLSGQGDVTFVAKDNFSGVSSYEATLDGEWIALDLSGSRLTHRFRGDADGEEHTLEIKVKDLVGNETTLVRRFRR